jgi:LacI family transcriptional regulator
VLLGWRIPEELALLGTDNRPLVLGKLPIAVSSVDSNLHAVGWSGAGLLERLMNGERAPAKPIQIAPGRVVSRTSTATFVCEHPGVSSAMKFLRTHFHEPIHLDDIARAAGVSARVLQSAFKEHVRRTMSDELARLRLSHAARLLCETDLKLESVAREAGLRNAKYLCEVFRPAFDATPSAYREASQTAGRVPVSLTGI